MATRFTHAERETLIHALGHDSAEHSFLSHILQIDRGRTGLV